MEAACVAGARRQATIRCETPSTVLRVSSTRLEQASPACQLHFNKVFLRSLVRRLQEPIPPRSIRWAVCNILEHDPQRRLRLNISNKLLEQMHPADLADIVEELGPEDRQAIFENMDREAAAEALAEVDPDIQASILESLEAEMAAEIVEEMSPDQAADVLADLDERASEEILEIGRASCRERV